MAKRRKRIAPFESRLSRRSQSASGWHAPDTSTGPPEPRRWPPGRRLAERDQTVAPELAQVLAVAERDLLERALVELVAGEPVGAVRGAPRSEAGRSACGRCARPPRSR